MNKYEDDVNNTSIFCDYYWFLSCQKWMRKPTKKYTFYYIWPDLVLVVIAGKIQSSSMKSISNPTFNDYQSAWTFMISKIKSTCASKMHLYLLKLTRNSVYHTAECKRLRYADTMYYSAKEIRPAHYNTSDTVGSSGAGQAANFGDGRQRDRLKFHPSLFGNSRSMGSANTQHGAVPPPI